MNDRVLLEDVAPLSEKEFQGQVVELATALGYMIYHTWDSRHSPAGFPDLILLRGHRCVVAELKKDKAPKPTPKQREWLAAWALIPGAEAHVWRPRDWEALKRVLH